MWLLLVYGTLLAMCVACVSAWYEVAANAQEKSGEKGGTSGMVSGEVREVNKKTTTITIAEGSAERLVVFTRYTTILFQDKPATIDDVTPGKYVKATGKVDRGKLVASKIDIVDRK